ncbi:MAG: DUF5320 domain-containing protein [Kiritimatiellae bacterium]|nr:DUF5320 domain-containing protein [Kiritimatiellia bacterium]
MPAGDGTGPAGMGPMTGRAAGYCAGYSVPGFMNPMPGRWMGGWGPSPYLAGAGYGYGYGPAMYGTPAPYGPAPFLGRGFGFGRGRGFFGTGRGAGWGRGFGRGGGRGWGRGWRGAPYAW